MVVNGPVSLPLLWALLYIGHHQCSISVHANAQNLFFQSKVIVYVSGNLLLKRRSRTDSQMDVSEDKKASLFSQDFTGLTL